jgi:hypothetical protein
MELEHFGDAEVSREADNLGTAMHCLSPEAEAEGRVQRRRNAKEHWRALRFVCRGANRLLSEKSRQGQLRDNSCKRGGFNIKYSNNENIH